MRRSVKIVICKRNPKFRKSCKKPKEFLLVCLEKHAKSLPAPDGIYVGFKEGKVVFESIVDMTSCCSCAVEKSDGNDEEDKYIIIKKILHKIN